MIKWTILTKSLYKPLRVGHQVEKLEEINFTISCEQEETNGIIYLHGHIDIRDCLRQRYTYTYTEDYLQRDYL